MALTPSARIRAAQTAAFRHPWTTAEATIRLDQTLTFAGGLTAILSLNR